MSDTRGVVVAAQSWAKIFEDPGECSKVAELPIDWVSKDLLSSSGR